MTDSTNKQSKSPALKIVIALALIAGAVGVYYQTSKSSSGSARVTFEVQRGDLRVIVLEGGNVEARESQEIKPELTYLPIPTPLVNPPAADNMIPSGPPIDTTPQSSDEHGFEWINHNGKDYYRPIGQMVDWKEFQN